jgi:hypothetical protein
MDSMDTVRERIEALEPRTERLQQPTRIVERRLRWWRSPWGVAAAVALGLALTSPHAVQAKTFDCGAGDVQCLIDAIHEANANGERNTIHLEAGTYTLTAVDNIDNDRNGLPVITSPLTITGRGAETTIIARDTGAPDFRLFMVAAQGTLSLNRLTLAGGGGFLSGGAIFNSGTLTVTRSTIRDNSAFENGGIANVGGTVTITHSTIAYNDARSSGGLSNSAGTVRITGTTFASNVADGAGAIRNSGTLTVIDSSFTDNLAFVFGTGTIMNFGLLEVTNTTFARNVTTSALDGVGAAIANSHTLLLTNSTLADNQVAGGTSGSALASAPGATTSLQNTLLARNVGLNRPGQDSRGPDCLGVVLSLGHNLIGDPTGCTITLQPSDLTGDPGLGDFTDTDRPGQGHFPLLPTSQAIDAGNKAVCPRTDQLGRLRLGPCDIGAIEFRHRDDRPHDEEDEHHDKDLAAATRVSSDRRRPQPDGARPRELGRWSLVCYELGVSAAGVRQPTSSPSPMAPPRHWRPRLTRLRWVAAGQAA